MNLSFRHYYWRWLKNLCFLFFAMAIVMTLARMSFALYFGDWNEILSFGSDLRAALILGLRYDLMPLAYINVLPFLILNLSYFIPSKTTIRFARSSVTFVLCCGYYFLVWLYVFDYGFYSYFQDHLNILFFGFFEDDTKALLTSIWKNYNLPFWLTVLFIAHYVFYRIVKFAFSPFEFDLKEKRSFLKVSFITIAGVAFLIFAGRGTYTRRPLSLEDAHISQNDFINKLSLNGILTFNRAMKIRKTFGFQTFDYLKDYHFANWEEAYQAAFHKKPTHTNLIKNLISQIPQNLEVEKNPPHVVMVIMESFGSYWNPLNSPQFNLLGDLDRHFKQGLLFNNFLSAENGTIGSVVSIATSQVIRPGSRFLSESDFMKTALDSSGHLPYKKAGYDTHFVYGGMLGWRDLGKYLTVQGYDFLWGAEEMKESLPELNHIESQDLGNEWGVFDEYLYAFLEEQLRTATKPQFFLVLTTSNHPPFEYPSSYQKLSMEIGDDSLKKMTISKDLAEKRFLSLQYANQKVADFLNRIQAGPLKEKVVLALTGDHSYWVAKGVEHDEEFKRYAVPFFISLPERLKPQNVDLSRFGSHEDIFPTLYHVTLSGLSYVKLGENLFVDESTAINSSGLIASKAGAYHHESFWRWKDSEKRILEPSVETPELLTLKKTYQGMIGITDMYLKEEKARKQTALESDRP